MNQGQTLRSEGAERVALSRANKRSREEQEIHDRFSRAHREWLKTNPDFKGIDKFENLTEGEAYWLVQAKDEYLIIQRRTRKNKTQKPQPRIHPYDTKEKAEEDFSRIKTNDAPPYWLDISEISPKAKSFLNKYKNRTGDEPLSSYNYYPLWDIRFIFALSNLIEFGHEYKDEISGNIVTELGTKATLSDTRIKNIIGARQHLLKNFKGLSFEGRTIANIKEVISRMFKTIAEDVNEEGFTTKSTYDHKSTTLVNSIKNLSNFVVYKDVELLIAYAQIEREKVLNQYLYNEDKDIGTIIPCDNFPIIPFDHLRLILDLAWDYSPKFYNNLIIELTTTLRPAELRRLIQTPLDYIVNNASLDYGSKKLITKTLKKRKKKLTNPRLSIVGRLILFHDKVISHDNFFSKRKEGAFRLKFPDLEIYTLRSFRTTAATILAYVASHNMPNSTINEVQLRLGHVNGVMAQTVYATTPYSQETPKDHFAFLGEVWIDSMEIAFKSNFWDAWLLDDYLRRNKEAYDGTPEWTRIKENCRNEANNYNNYKEQKKGHDLKPSRY